MKIGWRRALDRLLLLLLLALYLHFFRRTQTRRAPFLFSSFFLFFGEIGGGRHPTYVATYGRRSQPESNYAMSTSGRTFKLPLIKYWLHVVFFITIELFVRSELIGSICIELLLSMWSAYAIGFLSCIILFLYLVFFLNLHLTVLFLFHNRYLNIDQFLF